MKLETKEELEKELTIIEKWEKDQKGLWFWERIGRIPFKLLDKLTPDFIQKNWVSCLMKSAATFRMAENI